MAAPPPSSNSSLTAQPTQAPLAKLALRITVLGDERFALLNPKAATTGRA